MVAPELEVSFLSIVREGRGFIPKGTDAFEAGDEVYFLVVKEKIDNAVHAFDMEKPVVERVVIFGGGQIALNLARKLESDDTILSCKIIEENQQEARKLARELNNTVLSTARCSTIRFWKKRQSAYGYGRCRYRTG